MNPEALPANSRANASEGILIVAVWLILAVGMFLLARQNFSVPGLYYDEAVFAGMAKDFVTGHEHGRHMPYQQVIPIFGRHFPLFVQPYLGALKSWMFFPSFSVFGTSMSVLRATTVCWSALGLLLFMFAAWRWLGATRALLAGTILAADPTYFFLGVIDWGAAVPSFVCRFASFYLLVQWCRKRRGWELFLAAFFAGLGFFNKVDFGVLILGCVAAAAVCYRTEVKELLRGRAQQILLGLLGFVLGAGPMLFNVAGLTRTVLGGSASAGPGEFGEKLHTTMSMYDGSYFYRLMEVGGMFRQMFTTPMNAPSMMGAIFIILSVGWLFFVIKSANREQTKTASVLLLAAALVTLVAFLAPGAIRIHHAVVVYPLPQLIMSVAINSLWNVKATRRWILPTTRTIALLLFAGVLANAAAIISKTEKLIAETGGRGLWSDSLNRFCREYGHRTDLVIVSLDWGFNEQLAFLTDGAKLSEPAWILGTGIPRGTPLAKDPGSIYLMHPVEYAIAPESLPYLSVTEDSQQNVEVQPYVDRQGQIAFYAIRFPPQ